MFYKENIQWKTFLTDLIQRIFKIWKHSYSTFHGNYCLKT